MADSNLQQYNGAASFPARTDVGTNADPFLAPTDGPVVTAESNALGFAPVNRALKRVKDLLLGLRGATIGDFAGAVRKSFYSFYADGQGGNTQVKPAGNIHALNSIIAESGDLVAELGAVESTVGPVRTGNAGGERCQQFKGAILWSSVTGGASGGNPAAIVPLANQVRPLNTCKAWALFQSDGIAGPVVNLIDGASVGSVVKTATDFVVTFSTAFDSADYCVDLSVEMLVADAVLYDAKVVGKTTNTATVRIWTNGPPGWAATTDTHIIHLVAYGRQTT